MTYAGKPLYWFSGDTAAGQVHGNVTDTWGKWSAVVTAKPARSSSQLGRVEPPAAEELGSRARVRRWEVFMSSDRRCARSLARSYSLAATKSARRTVEAVLVVACLSPRVLDCWRGRRARRDRLVESLGWCRLCRLDDKSSCHRDRSADPGDYRGVPRCGAIAAGTTATDVRPRLPPRPPLHGAQRDTGRAARHRADALLFRGGPQESCRGSSCRSSARCRVGARLR